MALIPHHIRRLNFYLITGYVDQEIEFDKSQTFDLGSLLVSFLASSDKSVVK